MTFEILEKYAKEDVEKTRLIDSLLNPPHLNYCLKEISFSDMAFEPKFEEPLMQCPSCGEKYPESEMFCMKCGVKLTDIEDVNIYELEVSHVFDVAGENVYESFEEIFSENNIKAVRKFNLRVAHFKKIIDEIRMAAIANVDKAIKENDINLKELSVLEKILLFSKSFVDIEYKSQGSELGYYEFNRIYVDDRQLDALQITTLLHELTHFLIKEIVCRILCLLLDCAKTAQIESVATYILSYSQINQLIDEYAAHTVEGRFTLMGYQDYSSFLNIQNSIDAPDEEIEMIKAIGNTLADHIKKIIEAYVDRDMLEEIKRQFKSDIMERPDYSNLEHENCMLLNGRGLIQALRLVMADGFEIACDNIDTLKKYNMQW
ncbi:zinc ribbon domain-containing protein [uncultured Methanobrevibacter sp.]|uniref:zinc ribbon domain-containing protein n=1 Tax=uncultured Methanobrevibacter sp. TaxID=253161 RepID=UPI00260BC7B2|nr:zinc ribbon domain-containing protein [uncultured Methanobrevibacter sp.]